MTGLHDRAPDVYADRAAYTVEVNPEFPGTGEWSDEAVAFDLNGSVTTAFRSPWGTPVVVRFSPEGGEPWIGTFPAGSINGVTGVYPTASPTQVCVIVSGHAFAVNTDAPADGATVPSGDVLVVEAAPRWDLLLLVSYTDIAAIGRDGIAWQSNELAMDCVCVTSVDGDGIDCVGMVPGNDEASFTLDPASGRVVAGRAWTTP